MTDAPDPRIHPATDEISLSKLVKTLVDPEREREGTGWHVVVQVFDGGSTVFARLNDESQLGHGSQRWLKHARRGASPGGWSEEHHPRSEVELGAWRAARAEAIDRRLIQCSKQAWKCEGTAPYAVEFAPQSFD